MAKLRFSHATMYSSFGAWVADELNPGGGGVGDFTEVDAKLGDLEILDEDNAEVDQDHVFEVKVDKNNKTNFVLPHDRKFKKNHVNRAVKVLRSKRFTDMEKKQWLLGWYLMTRCR